MMRAVIAAAMAALFCAGACEAVPTAVAAAPQDIPGGPVCGARGEIGAALADGYGEARAGLGLAGNGAVVELFRSAEGETFTIIMTAPSGWTCLLAAGEDWEAVPPPPAGRAM
jgi:hypothetical protein